MISNHPWLKELHLDYPIHNAKLPFGSYIAETRALIAKHRLDLQHHAELHINANTPWELLPQNSSRTGVLMVHGLFDSPYTMSDLGKHLQQHGILARSVLLPGHGIFPGCLIPVTHQDWQQCVQYGIDSLSQEVDRVFLIGYSMGSMLSLYQTLKNPKIAGVVLLAPSFELQRFSDMLVRLYKSLSLIRQESTWLFVENEIDYVRYSSIPAATLREFHKTCLATIQLSQTTKLHCPSLFVCSEEDEIVSTSSAIQFFQTQLQGDQHQMILYSAKKNPQINDPRITIRNSRHKEMHIKNLSHIGLPLSPDNAHYGKDGDFAFASRLKNGEIYGAYNKIEVRMLNWLHRKGLKKKSYQELTFNPDFDFMADAVTKFITAR